MPMPFPARPVIAAAAALALVGCAVGPDYARPEAEISQQWLEAHDPGPIESAWWQRFDRSAPLHQHVIGP